MVTYVDYDEGDATTYRGVGIYVSSDRSILFNSGDFPKDWWDALRKVYDLMDETGQLAASSSSVDHFLMDGADELYDLANLIQEDGKLKLVYRDDFSEMEWWNLTGATVYVNTGERLSFDEFKEKYR